MNQQLNHPPGCPAVNVRAGYYCTLWNNHVGQRHITDKGVEFNWIPLHAIYTSQPSENSFRFDGKRK